jgi:HlyD family secretion protein
VKLVSKQVLGAVLLPMKVIQFDNDNKPYVFKESAEGKAVRADIETGINDGTTVEIKNGVSDGEAILYSTASDSGTGFMGGRRNSDNSDGGNN